MVPSSADEDNEGMNEENEEKTFNKTRAVKLTLAAGDRQGSCTILYSSV